MGTGYEAGASFPEHADLAGTGIEAAVGTVKLGSYRDGKIINIFIIYEYDKRNIHAKKYLFKERWVGRDVVCI